MKFGPVPLAEAEGALLAHTLRTGAGALKKGHRLGPEDLRVLAKEGYAEVIAARLEPGDVDEDAAAAHLAAPFVGPGIRAEAAKTGRANLFATTRGVFVVDAAAVDAVNAVDPALTVATVPAYRLVEPGDMVATVKIIPFSAAADALAAAATAARPLRVAPLVARRAGLVLTTLPGVKDAQLDRAAESQRARLAHLGCPLARELRCPHTEADVQASLRALLDDGCTLLLVLGASAIVDARDVIPQALLRVGGELVHLGMPVDPGNLLLLGRVGGATAIGVPGCARSLKRSGFDAVLERTVAGLEVGGADIVRMGVGGLLTEIPSRPAPRRGAPRRVTPRVGAVLLAAGRSRRMGAANKLLVEVDGVPMVRRVADALLESRADPVVVVTGHEAEAVRAALPATGLRVVHNPSFAEGMSTSVKAGLAALDEDVDAALVALGDMPWIRSGHVDALIAAFDPGGPYSVCVPTFDRKRGNPVLWSARHFPEMQRLTGDAGARGLLEAHAAAVRLVPVEDAAVNLDVDTPEALADLTSRQANLL